MHLGAHIGEAGGIKRLDIYVYNFALSTLR